MFFKEPLTDWFFVEPKMVLLCLKNLLKHLYFLKCMCKYIRDRAGTKNQPDYADYQSSPDYGCTKYWY